jgi:hypothetical protein
MRMSSAQTLPVQWNRHTHLHHRDPCWAFRFLRKAALNPTCMPSHANYIAAAPFATPLGNLLFRAQVSSDEGVDIGCLLRGEFQALTLTIVRKMSPRAEHIGRTNTERTIHSKPRVKFLRICGLGVQFDLTAAGWRSHSEGSRQNVPVIPVGSPGCGPPNGAPFSRKCVDWTAAPFNPSSLSQPTNTQTKRNSAKTDWQRNHLAACWRSSW